MDPSPTWAKRDIDLKLKRDELFKRWHSILHRYASNIRRLSFEFNYLSPSSIWGGPSMIVPTLQNWMKINRLIACFESQAILEGFRPQLEFPLEASLMPWYAQLRTLELKKCDPVLSCRGLLDILKVCQELEVLIVMDRLNGTEPVDTGSEDTDPSSIRLSALRTFKLGSNSIGPKDLARLLLARLELPALTNFSIQTSTSNFISYRTVQTSSGSDDVPWEYEQQVLGRDTSLTDVLPGSSDVSDWQNQFISPILSRIHPSATVTLHMQKGTYRIAAGTGTGDHDGTCSFELISTTDLRSFPEWDWSHHFPSGLETLSQWQITRDPTVAQNITTLEFITGELDGSLQAMEQAWSRSGKQSPRQTNNMLRVPSFPARTSGRSSSEVSRSEYKARSRNRILCLSN
ncbi:hypothetical protein C8Q76DRAFT_786387 [Earliella scabrosa]|nr:hypothetical protein C8Q76DRAFT_786387 [Earliella scabrosa]